MLTQCIPGATAATSSRRKATKNMSTRRHSDLRSPILDISSGLKTDKSSESDKSSSHSGKSFSCLTFEYEVLSASVLLEVMIIKMDVDENRRNSGRQYHTDYPYYSTNNSEFTQLTSKITKYSLFSTESSSFHRESGKKISENVNDKRQPEFSGVRPNPKDEILVWSQGRMVTPKLLKAAVRIHDWRQRIQVNLNNPLNICSIA